MRNQIKVMITPEDMLPKQLMDYAKQLTQLVFDTGLTIFNDEVIVKDENNVLYTIRWNMNIGQFEVVSSEKLVENGFYDAYICEQACKYNDLYTTFQENLCKVGNVYRFTDDLVSEYCVAMTKEEAFELFKNFWDEEISATYVNEYLTKYPDKNLNDFIEENIHLEFPETLITEYDTHENTETTKMAVEWALDHMVVPTYLFHSKW